MRCLGLFILAVAVAYGVDLAPRYLAKLSGDALKVVSSAEQFRGPCNEPPTEGTRCTDRYVIPHLSFSGAEAIGLGMFVSATEIFCASNPAHRIRFGSQGDTSRVLELLKTYQTVDLRTLPCRGDLVIEAWGPTAYSRAGFVGAPILVGDATRVAQAKRLVEFFSGQLNLLLAIALLGCLAVRSWLLRRLVAAGEMNGAFSKSVAFWSVFACVKSGLTEFLIPSLGISFASVRLANLSSELAHARAAILAVSGKWIRKSVWTCSALVFGALAVSSWFGHALAPVIAAIAILNFVVGVRVWNLSLVLFAVACAVEAMKVANVPSLPYGSLTLLYASFEIFADVMQGARRGAQATEKLHEEAWAAKMLAHDIRAPLDALKVASAIGNESVARNAMNRIEEIAGDVLRRDENAPNKSPKVIWVAREVSSVMDEFRVRSDREFEMRLEGTGVQNIRAVGCPSEFRRIVANLISNSVDATSSRFGKVDISVMSSDDRVHVRIQDNGKGIAREVLPRLFQEVVTHGKRNGSGMGLYSARKVLEGWGGDLSISSMLNEGTEVLLQLRRRPEKQTRYDFVLIDNDELVRQTWQAFAESRGLSVVIFDAASSFAAAMSEISFDTPLYVDRYLGNGECGINFATALKNTGFGHVFVSTGSIPATSEMNGLNFVGKHPPVF